MLAEFLSPGPTLYRQVSRRFQSRPYSTRLRVKRLRVGIKGFYSGSVRRAPRSPLRKSIAHVRACSWATRGRSSASPYVRRGALGRVALPWPREPLSALRAARRAPPQQTDVSGAAKIVCEPRGASAALTRRRAAAVEACTHTCATLLLWSRGRYGAQVCAACAHGRLDGCR